MVNRDDDPLKIKLRLTRNPYQRQIDRDAKWIGLSFPIDGKKDSAFRSLLSLIKTIHHKSN
uniref:Peroxisomal membrane protein PMP22-like n=1 Tax=Rhizophora mucronata TaxID=61149 RepID=A0A2P2KNA5_RHIMU